MGNKETPFGKGRAGFGFWNRFCTQSGILWKGVIGLVRPPALCNVGGFFYARRTIKDYLQVARMKIIALIVNVLCEMSGR